MPADQAATTFEDWAARAEALEVGGLRLAVHDDGARDASAPVVTFLHGYPSSSLDGVPVLERLDGVVRFLSVDLPGFGASEKPPHYPYSIHRAADAVEGLWEQHGAARTVVLAHDYSVSVAQELLARQLEDATRPTSIAGVVWTNGGLWPDLHRQTTGQQLLRSEDGAAVAEAMDEAALTVGLQGTWGTRRPMAASESHGIWRSMEHEGGSKISHTLLHYIDDRLEHAERWNHALDAAPVPMRFVWGDLDPVSGGHVADRLEERLPRWPPDRAVQRLDDVGHWPPLEAPDEVAAAVRDPRDVGTPTDVTDAIFRQLGDDDLPWQEVKRQQNADGSTSSVWEAWFAFRGDPPYLSLLARWDPGMIVRRHGHRSDHVLYVVEGEVTCGDRPCPAGTHVELPQGAAFGPFRAGPDGCVLFEVMMGDPRSWGDQPELVATLRATHGVIELPDPEIDLPDWLEDERRRWADAAAD